VTTEIRTDIFFKDKIMIFQVGDEVISTRGNGKGTILHPAAPGLWQVQWESGSILATREQDLLKVVKPVIVKDEIIQKTYNLKKIKKPSSDK
jgi:hypothetical protein